MIATMANRRLWVGLILMFFALGCASSGKMTETAQSGDKNNSEVQVENSTASLADYLRKVPGLTVQGTGGSAMVFVRGSQSVNSSNQPLFVVDGSRAGRSFARLSSFIDVNDIDSIKVLKGNEASSRYGMAGSSGVVIIRTKKD